MPRSWRVSALMETAKLADLFGRQQSATFNLSNFSVEVGRGD
jgi:hypothetical protein